VRTSGTLLGRWRESPLCPICLSKMQWAAPSGLHPLSSIVSQPRVELTVKYKCHRSERQCVGSTRETGNRTGTGRVYRSRCASWAMHIFGSPRHSPQELKHSLYNMQFAKIMLNKALKRKQQGEQDCAACHLCSGIAWGVGGGGCGVCGNPGPLPPKKALAGLLLLSSCHIECCLLFYWSPFR